MLAKKDIKVPINKTGTGYMDSINDKKAKPKNPIVPMPINITKIIC